MKATARITGRGTKPGTNYGVVKSAAIPYLTAALVRRYGDHPPKRITRSTRVTTASGTTVTAEMYLRWYWIFDVRGALKP